MALGISTKGLALAMEASARTDEDKELADAVAGISLGSQAVGTGLFVGTFSEYILDDGIPFLVHTVRDMSNYWMAQVPQLQRDILTATPQIIRETTTEPMKATADVVSSFLPGAGIAKGAGKIVSAFKK